MPLVDLLVPRVVLVAAINLASDPLRADTTTNEHTHF